MEQPKIYDLIQLGERTYYIHCPTNMLVYLRDSQRAVLVDSGNSSNVGKTVAKILEGQGWTLDSIITSHAHADHISGNQYLQRRYGCPIFANRIEAALTTSTTLLPSIIYGGSPPKKLLGPAMYAKPSVVLPLEDPAFPTELEVVPLPGHSPDQIGVRTPDNVVYLGDAYMGAETIEKYHISFIYNLEQYLETLDRVEGLTGRLFVPAHDQVTTDPTSVVAVNRGKISEILGQIRRICQEPVSFEELLAQLFRVFSIDLNFNQYYLISTTIKAYLSYLLDRGEIAPCFREEQLVWQVVPLLDETNNTSNLAR